MEKGRGSETVARHSSSCCSWLTRVITCDPWQLLANLSPLINSQSMESIEAFILAGGASTRMGTDKSRLLLDGQTFSQRIANTLREVASEVTIVGRCSED